MDVPADVLEQVRQRASSACEYCGVSESDARGTLTIDHFKPKNHEGTDDPANLVYACFRCNQYKGGYWPKGDEQVRIWNPRIEPSSTHLFELDDGRLLALTDVGRETISRLRLNRPPLVQARMRKRQEQAGSVLLERLAEITTQLANARTTQASLSAEENSLLMEQQRILEALRSFNPSIA